VDSNGIHLRILKVTLSNKQPLARWRNQMREDNTKERKERVDMVSRGVDK
jgi:hypothetical protein